MDGIRDFELKFLIKVDGIFIVGLHVQVDLTNVLLGAELNDMI